MTLPSNRTMSRLQLAAGLALAAVGAVFLFLDCWILFIPCTLAGAWLVATNS